MKGMPGMEMMQKMMQGNGECGCGDFDPKEMCGRMLASVETAASMANLATPEVRALFDEWASAVEGEISEMLRAKGSASAKEIAEALRIGEKSAIFFLAKMLREGKVFVPIFTLGGESK